MAVTENKQTAVITVGGKDTPWRLSGSFAPGDIVTRVEGPVVSNPDADGNPRYYTGEMMDMGGYFAFALVEQPATKEIIGVTSPTLYIHRESGSVHVLAEIDKGALAQGVSPDKAWRATRAGVGNDMFASVAKGERTANSLTNAQRIFGMTEEHSSVVFSSPSDELINGVEIDVNVGKNADGTPKLSKQKFKAITLSEHRQTVDGPGRSAVLSGLVKLAEENKISMVFGMPETRK